MPKIISLVFCVMLLIQSNGQTSASKVYLEHYFDLYVPIQKDLWDLTVSITKGQSDAEIEKKRQELTKTIATQRRIVKSSPNFENDSTLRLQVYYWLTIAKKIVQSDYIYLMQLKSKAQNSPEDMKVYLDFKGNLSYKLQKTTQDVDRVAQNFASKNALRIIDDYSKLGQKIKTANEAFGHYDKVYYEFFKSYYAEKEFNTALNSKNALSIKKARRELNIQADKSLLQLNQLASFNGDYSLVEGAKKIVSSYKNTSNGFGTHVEDFYQLQHQFDSVKRAVVGKDPSQRTNEDIMAYNNTVKAYNAKVPEFKAASQSHNVNRRNAINQWNETVNQFIKKQVL